MVQLVGRSRRAGGDWRRVQARKGAAFTSVFFIGFALLFVLPLLYAVWQSLFAQRSSGLGLGNATTVFVGLDNFALALGDEAFWAAMGRVTVFALVQIPVMLLISLGMALVLDAARGRTAKVFRMAFLVPYMIPGIVATLVWIYLYSPLVGPLTPMFAKLGLDVSFFAPGSVWVSMGNLLTWMGVGFNMLIIYSSLRAVPRELFDAARVDGASAWRMAWSIKIPYVRGTLVLTGMLSIIHMLQIFNEPLLFRSVTPETVNKSFTPIMMVYFQAFASNNYNYAAALSVIIAVLVGTASAVFYRLANRTPV